ncbi:MAG: GTPase ObgE [Candidatus Berkelbacteria bacterium]|nr:GTPase ObgE [Candidatus Berkelbacteria bacterium]
MIDYARITALAGKGGNGAGSFRHVKGKRLGKADGGTGGPGGNVLIEATADLSTLEGYRFVKDYRAPNGQNGLSNLRRGARGADLVLKVPTGTVVTIDEVKYDLTQVGDQALVVRGGEGGKGNSYLRDEFGRRPRRGEVGQPGECAEITLELKLIADVGLIGLPNAGKSTLLSVLTAAKPQVASYPFTTLEPNLGVMTVGEKRIVIADIPGLIEGASSGKGLGDLFLKHIERTKVLVHLIDISKSTTSGQGTMGTTGLKSQISSTKSQTNSKYEVRNTKKVRDTRDTLNSRDNFEAIWQDYQTIRQELRTYSKELVRKKEIVVLTKTDLADGKIVEGYMREFGKRKKKVFAISSENREGLENLIGQILKVI